MLYPATYTLLLPQGRRLTLARLWLLLGITALAIAGLFSILLVLLRTPGLQDIIPFKDFFHTALVTHVNLSVLVWMLSMSSMLWSLIGNERFYGVYLTTFWLAAAGTLCMALVPFVGDANPLMNNYVPVLQHPLFFVGLAMFFCAILFQVALTLLTYLPWKMPDEERTVMHYAIYYGAVITLVSILAFIISTQQLSVDPDAPSFTAEHYYEVLFWGGGHIVQITYVHMMLIAWLWLYSGNGFTTVMRERSVNFVLSINVLVVIPVLFIYINHTASSPENITFFTMHMRWTASIAAILVIIAMLAGLIAQRPKMLSKPEFGALLCSILLFSTGGIIGFLISGYNVTIPAHYHGSIIGISLAFMGLAYHLLPRLGYGRVQGKMAIAQPYIMFAGQLLHVTGLALSGGYGALRKTPGAVLNAKAQFWMGLMGLGGLLAIIGGLLFVILCVKAIRQQRD